MHAKLNELITNLNAHVRIWMLEKTLPGTVAKLNALDAYLNLNDVNAKFLDRSANLNDRNTNLNYGFHGPDLFREFEWLLHQIEWQICEIDRENLYYLHVWKVNLSALYACMKVFESCDTCDTFSKHISMANISRLECKKDGLAEHEKGELVVSTDMQKVVMLPRLPGLKQAIFCRRLVVFHQTLAPIGTVKKL